MGRDESCGAAHCLATNSVLSHCPGIFSSSPWLPGHHGHISPGNSRLGRAWMAIREDEVAADCAWGRSDQDQTPGVCPGASFSGWPGPSMRCCKPFSGIVSFQVSIMLPALSSLGVWEPQGGHPRRHVVMFFDRVVLAQSTQLVRSLGRLVGSELLMCRPVPVALVFLRSPDYCHGATPEGLGPSQHTAAERTPARTA